ncbi:ATP synthase F0 subunit C [bacterium]|nr:ATP synthase F0 subunit C [bacterium]MBU1599380.1 ATP synthase F0 subunit C [bacterium]
MEALVAGLLTAGFGLAITAMGAAIGQGIATAKAVEGIARQPEASGKIQVLLIIGLAFMESLVLYVLLISMLETFLFAKPLLDKLLAH